VKVSELGQFALIDRLAEMVEATRNEKMPSWQNLIVGIGDDCAAWRCDGALQLAHVDCQVEGVHFRPEYGSWRELGWKALAVITSDVAAKGGSPRYALISLTIPGSMEVENITDLYKGMIDLAKEEGIAIVGGHISRATLFTVTITITGAANGNILLRSAAKVGDKIAVTGTLGGATAYVEMIERKLKFNTACIIALKNTFLHPHPRVKEGQLLVAEGVEAGMDISDGVMSDMRHICRASKVGAMIRANTIPINPEVRACFDSKEALELALGGGEDYELLFTGNEEIINRVKAKSSIPVTIIGDIVAEHPGELIVVDANGKPVSLSRTGWDHFAPPAGSFLQEG
jgi:thiamine-monophosphate kinase